MSDDRRIRESELVEIRASDGYSLGGRLHYGVDPAGPALAIFGATATPQRYYRHLAQAAADAGASAVLTFDYRGVAVSRPQRLRGFGARMRDWALLDIPAAVAVLRERSAGSELVGLGHSFGGQAFGLSGVASAISRFATVATMSGYWRLTDEPWRVYAGLNLLALPLGALLGYVPGRIGLGEDLPVGVVREWARWCRSPNYLFDDPDLPEKERFAEVTTPILAIGLSDDKWATPRAMRAMLEHYPTAPIEERWLKPEDAGRPIGHFGFFRPDMQATLWPPVLSWLLRCA
jgi:predicted alpha/beta hydrolase